MTETVESFLLQHLEQFQVGPERIERQFDEIVTRVGQLGVGVAGLRRDFAHADKNGVVLSVRLGKVRERLDRIERRLELTVSPGA